jgi:transcriptional regulator with XRE-family HTH domain
MSLISLTFANELNEKEMRDAYLSAQTRTHLSYQIRTIRNQRGWSQEEFAEKLNTSQSAVSRMEDRGYGKQSLQTLIQVANVFDCGLIVQFVPYEEFLQETTDLSQETLEVPEFNDDSLLPLTQELPPVDIDSSNYLAQQYAYNTANLAWTMYPRAIDSFIARHSQSLAEIAPSALTNTRWSWTDDRQNEQDHQIDSAHEAVIAELRTQVAELKAENERLTYAHATFLVVNRRPSQFPSFP